MGCKRVLAEKLKSRKRLFFAAFWNCLCYWGATLIADESNTISLKTAVDEKVPFLPWTILIYFGSYLFWLILYDERLKTAGRESNRFFYADLFAKAVCFFIFVFMPTTIDRPAVNGSGFWNGWIRFLYAVDKPLNLFPSIHCMNSWLCWIGIRGRKDRNRLQKNVIMFIASAICVSTLTVRQHVIADGFGGILLAELSYLLTGRLLKKS